MGVEQAAILAAVGLLAGVINSVVGSASLVTFPALVALGYPPVIANITNNIGVLPANIAGAITYRKYFAGQGRHLALIAAVSAAGGLAGALLLLQLPPEVFRVIVPFLIGFALILVIFGPPIKVWVLRRTAATTEPKSERGFLMFTVVALACVYGGYFGAAQGVILLAVFSLTLNGTLQRANAYKNAITAAGNVAAVGVFILIGEIAWEAAAILAVTSFAGGMVGGKYGQRLPENIYRVIIVVVGLAALTYFLLT